MTAFNYLDDGPSALLTPVSRALVQWGGVPIACVLLAIAFATIAAAAIEDARLTATRQERAIYQRRYELALAATQKERAYYGRVRALLELDRSVRRIVSSGAAKAALVEDIARRMPPEAWLRTLSVNASNAVFSVHGPSISTGAAILENLAQSSRLSNPSLLGAAASSQGAGVDFDVNAGVRP
jgi:hypothetical protein